MPHGARGEVKLIGQPVTLSRTPAALETPLPEKGEHSDAILAEIGYSADEIAQLRAGKAV